MPALTQRPRFAAAAVVLCLSPALLVWRTHTINPQGPIFHLLLHLPTAVWECLAQIPLRHWALLIGAVALLCVLWRPLAKYPLLPKIFCAVLLSCASVWMFLHGPTAFEWPATDMAPFFERMADPSFGPRDFYTNASTSPNPRFSFGYAVLGLERLSGTSWYTVIFFLKSLLIIALPALFFLVLTRAFEDNEGRPAGLATCAAATFLVMFLLDQHSNLLFATNGWYPFLSYAAAETMSIFFGLVACLISTPLASGVTTFVSALLHPVNGFGTALFWLVANPAQAKNRPLLFARAGGIGAAYIVVLLLFRSRHPASPTQFFDGYLGAARHHYSPSFFWSYLDGPWWFAFLLICALFAGLWLLFWWRRNTQAAFRVLIASAFYTVPIWISTLFIEAPFQVKQVLMFGPSRLTLWAYWCISILILSAISDDQAKTADNPVRQDRWSGWATMVGLTASILAAIALTSRYLDTPLQAVKSEHPALYSWVAANTAKDAVFENCSKMNALYFQLLSRRSLLESSALPFDESYYPEMEERHSAFDCADFSRQRLETIRSRYGLDYVIVDAVPGSSALRPIVFRGDGVAVLALGPGAAGQRASDRSRGPASQAHDALR